MESLEAEEDRSRDVQREEPFGGHEGQDDFPSS